MTETTKYTKGPWTFHENLSGSENHRGYGIYKGGLRPNYWIAEVSPVNDDKGDPTEGPHNARLISAAPELADALKALSEKYASTIESEYQTSKRPDPLKGDEEYLAAVKALQKAGI